METRVSFGQTDTGLAIGDFTWSYCKSWSGATVATASSTLVEIGGGVYILTNPNVSARTEFRIYKTADATVFFEGTFDPAAAALDAGADRLLCSLARLKTALGITTSAKDADLTATIAAASRWFEGEVGCEFTSTERTEYFSPGRGDDRVSTDDVLLRPRHYPIVSVTSLHEDNDRAFGAETLVDAADYYIGDAGMTLELYENAGTVAFSAGQRTVRLVYVSGYVTVPQDVQQAVLLLSIHLWQKPDRQKLGVASESVGGHTISYANERMPKEVQSIVDRYRRPCGW
jgi:hypothetical protein